MSNINIKTASEATNSPSVVRAIPGTNIDNIDSHRSPGISSGSISADVLSSKTQNQITDSSLIMNSDGIVSKEALDNGQTPVGNGSSISAELTTVSSSDVGPIISSVDKDLQFTGEKADGTSDNASESTSVQPSTDPKTDSSSQSNITASATSSASTTEPVLPPSTFIFGQNLSSRVANAVSSGPFLSGFASLASSTSSDSPFSLSTAFASFSSSASPSGSAFSTDKAPAGYLFAQALQQVQAQSTDAASSSFSSASSGFQITQPATQSDAALTGESAHGESGDDQKAKVAASDLKNQSETLTESARREYDAKQQKPVLEEVDVVTGEEGENNVFEVNVKMYVFDKEAQQWKERGRAIARLNDALDNSYSRLVIRMAGTLRIIINKKIDKDMVVKQLSEKNITFLALDSADENQPKVFQVSLSSHDAKLFHSEITHRIDLCKSEEELVEKIRRSQIHGETPPSDDPSHPTKKPKRNE